MAHAVPDEMLPVELPEVPDYSPKTYDPEDAAASRSRPCRGSTSGCDVDLDLGDGRGTRRFRRETNTMPNWAGSCWYYLRYLDPANTEALVDPENEAYWMGPRAEPVPGAPAGTRDPGGVDLYVGGVEHAVLHLLYARFWHKVLHDLGHLASEEPFRTYFSQGYIQAPAFTDARGQYVEAKEVEEVVGDDGQPAFTLERRAGHPRVRQDRQVAEEHGQPRRDVCRLRRRHLPALRDGPRAPRAEQAVGHPGGRGLAALPPAAVAQRRRRGDRRGRRRRRAARRRDDPRAAPHHRRSAHRLRRARVQHRDRPPHRAQQRPHQARRGSAAGGGRAARPHGGAAGAAHRRGAVDAARATRSRSSTRRSRSPTRRCSSRRR